MIALWVIATGRDTIGGSGSGRHEDLAQVATIRIRIVELLNELARRWLSRGWTRGRRGAGRRRDDCGGRNRLESIAAELIHEKLDRVPASIGLPSVPVHGRETGVIAEVATFRTGPVIGQSSRQWKPKILRGAHSLHTKGRENSVHSGVPCSAWVPKVKPSRVVIKHLRLDLCEHTDQTRSKYNLQ